MIKINDVIMSTELAAFFKVYSIGQDTVTVEVLQYPEDTVVGKYVVLPKYLVVDKQFFVPIIEK